MNGGGPSLRGGGNCQLLKPGHSFAFTAQLILLVLFYVSCAGKENTYSALFYCHV